jgi:fructose-bisphosphate aldolase, class I
MLSDTEEIAHALIADGKGILAADETPGTLTRRFEALGISSSEQSRRIYREMLFTAPAIEESISGVILQDETIRQTSSAGVALPQLLAERGILPGIKVDMGAKRLAGSSGETVTEGLDGLRERLGMYRDLGARFAKWRAVIRIGHDLPSPMCVHANAHALARYAALCQEQQIVPIVEPEVLTEGSHGIDRCEEVAGDVLRAVFGELEQQHVLLESLLLKPNMVTAGSERGERPSIDEVATATMRCLRRHVPAAVPGIVFLSGGQDEQAATVHLNAINRLPGTKPWKISFSYGRALQDSAMKAWKGEDQNLAIAAEKFRVRARCNSAATSGNYTNELESL